MLPITLCEISCRFVRWLVLCAPPVQCEFKQNKPSNPEIVHEVPDQCRETERQRDRDRERERQRETERDSCHAAILEGKAENKKLQAEAAKAINQSKQLLANLNKKNANDSAATGSAAGEGELLCPK